MKKLKGYIFSRNFLDERIPQHIQNTILRDYCRNNNYEFFLSFVEYAMQNSFLMLESLVHQLNNYDGILAYSLFQLPEKESERKKIIKKIVNNKKEIHFALENKILKNINDYEDINNIWLIKKTLIKNKEFYEDEKTKKFFKITA